MKFLFELPSSGIKLKGLLTWLNSVDREKKFVWPRACLGSAAEAKIHGNNFQRGYQNQFMVHRRKSA